jgi:SAM-dependent methyltransferase
MIAKITDKALLRRRMARAHSAPRAGADFLMAAVTSELAERLAGIDRHYPVGVVFGGRSERLASALRGTAKVAETYRMEQLGDAFAEAESGFVADEEALPLGRATVDLFVSALALQWTNDLPGALVQIRQALKPGGLFLGAMTGGATLQELRQAMFEAEVELRGGASPRVLPRAEIADLGALLQRAGFARPVADRDVLIVRYDSAIALAADLRAMGANNALAERDRRPASRRLMARMAEIYAERFSDADGRIRASFEIITLVGWAPSPERG